MRPPAAWTGTWLISKRDGNTNATATDLPANQSSVAMPSCRVWR